MHTENLQNLEIFKHSNEVVESAIVEWQDFKIGYFIQKNNAKSQYNEDSLVVFSKGEHLVFSVADGAGGQPKGREAAIIAGSELLEYAKHTDLNHLNPIELVEKINAKILELKAGAHSTFSMGIIHQDTFRTLSVGDSEVVYWNATSSIIYKNIPQSPVGHGIEAGLLDQDKSLDDPERHFVNNLLGEHILRVEVASKMHLKKGHTILLGSDGVFDNITHSDLTEIASKGAFEKSFETLTQKCLDSKKPDWKKDDDISFILIRKMKPA